MRYLQVPLRLCADVYKDQNKRIVLECGGMQLLIRCLDRPSWDKITPVALWNICAESDPKSSDASHSSSEDTPSDATDAPCPEISSIAARQLVLQSTGECDDLGITGQKNVWRDSKHIITALLEVADRLDDTGRREIVAELIEQASAQRTSTA